MRNPALLSGGGGVGGGGAFITYLGGLDDPRGMSLMPVDPDAAVHHGTFVERECWILLLGTRIWLARRLIGQNSEGVC